MLSDPFHCPDCNDIFWRIMGQKPDEPAQAYLDRMTCQAHIKQAELMCMWELYKNGHLHFTVSGVMDTMRVEMQHSAWFPQERFDEIFRK